MQENVYISNNTKPHTVPALGGGRQAGRELGRREVGMENATRSVGTSRAYGDEMKLVNLLKVR